jgi:hypothetical protein
MEMAANARAQFLLRWNFKLMPKWDKLRDYVQK